MDDELLARLDERSKAVAEKLDAQNKTFDEKLDAILTQTTKTNGRLTVVEGDVSQLKTWKQVREGQGKVLYWAGGLVLAVAGYLIKHFLG